MNDIIDGLEFISIIIIISILASNIRQFCVNSYALAVSIRFSRFIDGKLTFIGVIHHELSHLVLAILTGAEIKRVSLFKLRGEKLGEVEIVARGHKVIQSIQLTLSALAPVICGCISIYLIYRNLIYNSTDIRKIITALVLISNISYHMTLSKQDIKTAIRGIIPTLLVILTIFYFIEIDILYYKGYLSIILATLGLNFIIALMFRIVYWIKK